MLEYLDVHVKRGKKLGQVREVKQLVSDSV